MGTNIHFINKETRINSIACVRDNASRKHLVPTYSVRRRMEENGYVSAVGLQEDHDLRIQSSRSALQITRE